ncbi:MAG: recombination protein RecR [Candidatus Colwellbacteria bacterium]|nr:recombination protein RecR [Candidatus Colwellbacteria bacterium]
MQAPKPIKRFAEIFAALPGIGPRQAIRLAFYFIQQGVDFAHTTAGVIADLRKIKLCRQCFYIHENPSGLCDICEDKKRDMGVIAVVEKETDVMSIENTGKFNGRYLIIGDLRKTGVLETEQRLRLQSLKTWIEKEMGGKAKEIIIALNPNPQSDLIASLIKEELKNLALKTTRLGRGIPSGGEIEFADEETLGSALERRG